MSERELPQAYFDVADPHLAEIRKRERDDAYIRGVELHMDRVRRGAIPPAPKILDYRVFEQ